MTDKISLYLRTGKNKTRNHKAFLSSNQGEILMKKHFWGGVGALALGVFSLLYTPAIAEAPHQPVETGSTVSNHQAEALSIGQ
ncbi:MAG: hypothetical protein Q3974_06135 [Rothia sp. (in: high G+C Gram-positive bacteria)]|nr:hypothetical protein [Rothia sp. (in: high G+C Gram-positive bacteria)]